MVCYVLLWRSKTKQLLQNYVHTATTVSLTLIDLTKALTSLLEMIGTLSPQAQSLYIDLEGVNRKEFETSSSTGLILKAILESDSVSKVFFDI